MKHLGLIISVIALAAVIYLFADKFSGKNETTAKVSNNDTINVISPSGNIAYVKIDSLLAKYHFYNELEEKLIMRKANLEASLTNKAAALEQEFANFQKKEQTGAFVSQESYQRQGEELMAKREKLMASEQEMTQTLYKEGAEMEQQILDSVLNLVNEFNKKANYSYILNGGNLLYGEPASDITDTILNLLNERYNKSKTLTEIE